MPRSVTSTATVRVADANEARAIAKEAYIYGFPLVENYRILYSYFVDRASPEFKAPWNEIASTARLYTHRDKTIHTPNSDALYSYLGADLRAEPLVLSMPAVSGGRYYAAQFIDLNAFNVAYVGSRATGNDRVDVVLAGPDWHGNAPDGVKTVVRCESELAFVLYCTQALGANDLGDARAVQDGYTVQPLSRFLGREAPPSAPPIEFQPPLSAEEECSSTEFFTVLSFVLRFCPVQPTETALRARLAALGIGGDEPFDSTALAPEMRRALEQGISDAWQSFTELKRRSDTGEITSADVFGTREHLQNNYLYRMLGAVQEIHSHSREEVISVPYYLDSGTHKLDSGHYSYVLPFANGALPPVNGFWSLSMYALPSTLLVANRLKRYLINSAMVPSLARDAGGGLTVYLQHRSPGRDREANWLPAPDGPFFMVLRLYWPKPEALDGRWVAPRLDRID